MKVSELEGALLDAWVVKALGGYRGPYQMVKDGRPEKNCLIFPGCVPFRATTGDFKPSERWSEGGPIIEAYGLELRLSETNDPGWDSAPTAEMHKWQPGKSPLVAAMRAFVWRKYGEEVPDE